MTLPVARPLALVTGASSGIGRELAKQFAANGFDLIVAAEDVELDDAVEELRALGGAVPPGSGGPSKRGGGGRRPRRRPGWWRCATPAPGRRRAGRTRWRWPGRCRWRRR